MKDWKNKKMKKKPKIRDFNKTQDFNVMIAGVGGQGLITLLRIIATAALFEDYDVGTSELHGLSQRGGSVETHIRFGKEIYSPLVRQGGADLIIALEAQEALKSCYYASKEAKTTFLVNNFLNPISGGKKMPSTKSILKNLQGFSQKAILMPAAKICQKEVGTPITAGIFILGYVISKKLLPLSQNSALRAIKKIIPEKYWDINIQSLKVAKKYE